MRTRLLPLLLLACLPAAPLAAQPGPTLPLEYAVKVVCGAPDGRAVAPGRYFTVVNVHNPGTRSTVFRVKVATTQPRMRPGSISGFTQLDLRGDQALAIDCTDIGRMANLSGFLDGFLVIQSEVELDVVAVHTAGPAGGAGVETMHVERVPVRRLN